MKYAYQALAIDEKRRPFTPSIWTQDPNQAEGQVLEQAWFPGVHCDVGGGYAASGLSNAALQWMCERAERAGLALDKRFLDSPDPTCKVHDSMTPFYWLMRPLRRVMGASEPSGNERVSDFARDVKRAQPDYEPQAKGLDL